MEDPGETLFVLEEHDLPTFCSCIHLLDFFSRSPLDKPGIGLNSRAAISSGFHYKHSPETEPMMFMPGLTRRISGGTNAINNGCKGHGGGGLSCAPSRVGDLGGGRLDQDDYIKRSQ